MSKEVFQRSSECATLLHFRDNRILPTTLIAQTVAGFPRIAPRDSPDRCGIFPYRFSVAAQSRIALRPLRRNLVSLSGRCEMIPFLSVHLAWALPTSGS